MATEVYNYTFRSPVIGLHVPSTNQKLQDTSVTKSSFGPHPYLKEITTYSDHNAVAKSLMHDCYSSTHNNSVTKDAYTSPSEEKQKLSTINFGLKDAPSKCVHTKDMVQDFKYISNIWFKPDKQYLMGVNCTTNQLHYTPIPASCLKDRRLYHYDMQRNASLGNQVFDRNPQSEYGKSFTKKELQGEPKVVDTDTFMRSHYTPRGRAKLNVTHNIITGTVAS